MSSRNNSERAEAFYKVFKIVAKIPAGKVMTYGQIAKKLKITDARTVGWALHSNKNQEIPCHRVVNRFGKLAPGYVFGGPERQKEKLKKEGVIFKDENTVDLQASNYQELQDRP